MVPGNKERIGIRLNYEKSTIILSLAKGHHLALIIVVVMFDDLFKYIWYLGLLCEYNSAINLIKSQEGFLLPNRRTER